MVISASERVPAHTLAHPLAVQIQDPCVLAVLPAALPIEEPGSNRARIALRPRAVTLANLHPVKFRLRCELAGRVRHYNSEGSPRRAGYIGSGNRQSGEGKKISQHI